MVGFVLWHRLFGFIYGIKSQKHLYENEIVHKNQPFEILK